MADKVLSVFVDESGDFGPYEPHAPYYLVTMALHDQSRDIKPNIAEFERHLQNLGYKHHAVHTGPLIRREADYANDQIEDRKRLFNALFNFCRKLDFCYICVKISKKECSGDIDMTAKLSKEIAARLRSNAGFFNGFTHIIVYYDNGQIELTKILTAVFNALYTNVEFRKVKPADYKLFQIADLICTVELLAEKAESNKLTRSETEFFGGGRDLRKNYLKPIRKKSL